MRYSRIVPQYNELGFDSGLWMFDNERGICPNLVLGWLKGQHRVLTVSQVEDFYEREFGTEAETDEWWGEHVTELGTLDCSDTFGDEWEGKFADWIVGNDKAWWLF